jgi:tRNA G18 (ribose-2'-O)-methylase SpoU
MASRSSVTSADDARVVPYTHLTDAQARADALFLAESRLVLERLLVSRYPVRSVLVSERRADVIEPLLVGLDVPLLVAPQPMLEAIVGFNLHRGVIALGERLPDPGLPHAAERIVVLDGLNDAENVGSIFRTASALGWDAVALTGGTLDPLHRRALRVSMGEALHLPWTRLDDLPDDVTVAALVADGDVTLAAFEPPGRLALVLGAEHDGVSARLRARADVTVRIPMRAGVDSLSVTAAAAIALHALGG